MERPAMEAKGFPGSRLDAYRAGITAKTFTFKPVFCVAIATVNPFF
jgi:hypothetical protein